MLTDEQRAIRATGIGASEVAALVGLSPYKGPIDVWMLKIGLVKSEESPQAEVGSALEAGLVDLYERRTGFKVARPGDTRRHPEFAHVLASPDGLIDGDDRGLEIKIVGARMEHHWEGDTIPDYVLCQVAQNMAVTGRARWDVGALIGGTDFRVCTVDRDEALEVSLIESVETFWSCYVETREPPPVRDPDERRRYLRARYPGSAKTKCREEMSRAAERLAKKLVAAQATEKRAKARAADASTRLLELVRDDYGIEGAWGRYIAPAIAGRADWKAIAEEIAGGAVPAAVIEKHRGDPYRLPRFYPPKET